MFDALTLLKDLAEADVQWILDHGTERQVISDTLLIQEGTVPDSQFIVLQGLVGVTVTSSPGTFLAKLGPGEIFGEISFLEDSPASSTITAIENFRAPRRSRC